MMKSKYNNLAKKVVDDTAVIAYINLQREHYNEKYGTKLKPIDEDSAILNKILGVNADKEKEYHQEW